MINITITTMQGNTRTVRLASKQEALDFVELFQSTLHANQRVKITCDLIGLNGYVQGTK
jgi:hypothetical protein